MLQKYSKRSETAQELLAKAMLRLIVEHGADNVAGSDVMKATGITRAAMARYCQTEDDLWRITAEFIEQRMIEAWQPIVVSSQSPAERLRALLAIQIGLIMSMPVLQKILHAQSLRGANPAFREGMLGVRARFRTLLSSIMRDAIRAGQLPQSLDPEDAAQRIIDALQGRVVSWSLDLSSGDTDAEAWAPLSALLGCIGKEVDGGTGRSFGMADAAKGMVRYAHKKES